MALPAGQRTHMTMPAGRLVDKPQTRVLAAGEPGVVSGTWTGHSRKLDRPFSWAPPWGLSHRSSDSAEGDARQSHGLNRHEHESRPSAPSKVQLETLSCLSMGSNQKYALGKNSAKHKAPRGIIQPASDLYSSLIQAIKLKGSAATKPLSSAQLPCPLPITTYRPLASQIDDYFLNCSVNQ